DAGVPMHARRPDCQFPIVRLAIEEFTRSLVSENNRPTLTTNDQDTDRFLSSVFSESKFWDTMQAARNEAGAVGSSAIRLYLEDGRPRSEHLRRSNLWVVRWRSKWVPDFVIEQKLVTATCIEGGRLKDKRVWQTRAWDSRFEYVYEDVPENWSKAEDSDQVDRTPEMYRVDGHDLDDREIPIARDEDGVPLIFEHHMGRCPIHWLQNQRDMDCEDGPYDCDGAMHLADPIDRMQSKTVRATGANVDPTVWYADEERFSRRNTFFRKGLGQLFRMGSNGKIGFLEINGTSLEAGWKAIHELRNEFMQTVGVVIVDPSNAGTFKSGEALRMLLAHQEFATSRKRVSIGEA